MSVPKDIFETALREADKAPRQGRRQDAPFRDSQFTFKSDDATGDAPDQTLMKRRMRQGLPKIPRSTLGHAGSDKALRQRILQLQARLTRNVPSIEKTQLRREIARLKKALRTKRIDLPLAMIVVVEKEKQRKAAS